MCSHYHAVQNAARFRTHFGLELPSQAFKHDVWPGYEGLFIRRHAHADVGDEAVGRHEALVGRFGLVPHWAPDTRISRMTYNARSETVAAKPSFRDAWRQAQHCIIPADLIFEPDWRSGRAVPTALARQDGAPLGIAGLWARWRSPQGEVVYSYTMLTINAAHHELMRNFHRPEDEKRMVVVLPPERYDDWLMADARHSAGFLQPLASEHWQGWRQTPTCRPRTESDAGLTRPRLCRAAR
jgi:putative SOS response-associated peptidase YedK